MWRHDYRQNILYRKSGNLYVQYFPHSTYRLRTRSGGSWFRKLELVDMVKSPSISLCTVTKTTSTHALLLSTAYDFQQPMPPSATPIRPNPSYQAQCFFMQTFSDADGGTTLVHKL